MKLGQPQGLRPIGLGARDTLRLEKGYCLAGNEFEGGRTPLEAGLDFIVDWNIDFLGRDALRRQQEGGAHDQLIGLKQEKGIPRHGYTIAQAGKPIGKVTSGTLSPTLDTGIALGYTRGVHLGDTVDVEVRGKPFAATVVKPPFV
jgi:aminomethyltransferase